MLLFPGQLDGTNLDKMKTFREFDGDFTAPIHGYASADDYWTRASSKPGLSKITIPTLLINAANDPFLAPDCYPYKAAQENPNFYLEIPSHGGHVGFVSFNLRRGYGRHVGQNKTYWSEHRAMEFVEETIKSQSKSL